MKKKISAAAVLVCALLVIAAVAVAEITGLGILDFISRHPNAMNVSTDAQKLIQQQIPQSFTPNEYASFEIREAAYDGHNVYVVMAITPLQENVMMIPSGFASSYQMKDFLEGGTEEYVAEHAHNTGKRLLQFVIESTTSHNDDALIHKEQYTLDENGNILLLFSLPMENAPETQMMQAKVYIDEPEYRGDEPIDIYFKKRHEAYAGSGFHSPFSFSKIDASMIEITFHLDYVTPLWIAEANTPIAMPDPAITITKLQITTTPFASYIDMEYHHAKNNPAFPLNSFLHADFFLGNDCLEMNPALSPSLFQKTYTAPEIYPHRHYGIYTIIEKPPEDITLAFWLNMEDPESRLHSYEKFPHFSVPLSLIPNPVP